MKSEQTHVGDDRGISLLAVKKIFSPALLKTERIADSQEFFWEDYLALAVDRYCTWGGRMPLRRFLEHVEKEVLLQALNKVDGNLKDAARLLGVKYTTLHEKLKKHGIRFRKRVY